MPNRIANEATFEFGIKYPRSYVFTCKIDSLGIFEVSLKDISKLIRL